MSDGNGAAILERAQRDGPARDVDAERCLLGSVLLDPQAIDDVAAQVTPEDLYDPWHGRVYAAVLQVWKAGDCTPDVVAVLDLLRAQGLATQADAPRLADLTDAVPTAANVGLWARRVLEVAGQRRLQISLAEALQDALGTTLAGDQNLAGLLGRCESRLQGALATVFTDYEVGPAEAAQRALSSFQQAGAGPPPGTVPTGFSKLDALFCGGLGPGQLFLLAARPGMGKTTFALDIARRALERGQRVDFFSMEMGAGELFQALGCSVARVSLVKAKANTLAPFQRDDLLQAMEWLASSGMVTHEPPTMTTTELRARARRAVRQRGADLIVVDFLQLLKLGGGNSENRNLEVGQIGRELKELARELQRPVLALAQLNRAVEKREKRRPRMSDLRDSGSLEEAADCVILLHRDDYYEDDEKPTAAGGEMLVIVDKARGMQRGTVKMEWHVGHSRIEEVEFHG